MLFSELYKIMMNKEIFVGFTARAIVPIAPLNSLLLLLTYVLTAYCSCYFPCSVC